jgi:hypothetical protein
MKKEDLEYLKEIYEDEYKEKLSIADFWEMIKRYLENEIRTRSLK